MRQHERFGKELDLILKLSDGSGHTAEELCEVLGTTRRNLYYYFDFLRDYGFGLERDKTRYRLRSSSPFFEYIAGQVSFSHDEALLLYRLAEIAGKKNPRVEGIKNKLRRFYQLQQLTTREAQSRMADNVATLARAIDEKRVAMLEGYSSPHSGTVSNRLVEPFSFVNDQQDVRCYEIGSGKNKTFKLSRMQRVVLSEDLKWSHEDRHKEVFTDLFLFSGEQRHHVRLRFGLLAYNLMREEYPQARRCLTPSGDKHWYFEADIVSFLGLGRFCLGLMHDIEIIEGEAFRTFLREQAARACERLGQQPEEEKCP